MRHGDIDEKRWLKAVPLVRSLPSSMTSPEPSSTQRLVN
jgi:hypothetical protein